MRMWPIEREYTRRLSWVSSTATPASTLPTVNEISIAIVVLFEVSKENVLMLHATSAWWLIATGEARLSELASVGSLFGTKSVMYVHME